MLMKDHKVLLRASVIFMIRIMLDEILLFGKFLTMAKKNTILLIILTVFAISIVSVIPNSIKEHQASATIAGLGSSLANTIKQKVSNAIEESFNQTLSGLNNQISSAANVTNK
jgi:hypothetical protein